MKTYNVQEYINQPSEFFKILKYLPQVHEDGPWIAGGSVWKSIEKIPIDYDIDFFFKSENQINDYFNMLKSLPYCNRIISKNKNDFNTTFKFHIHESGYNKTISVQFISFNFWNNIEHLINEFDFTACQFAFDGKRIYSGDNSFEDLSRREIILNKITSVWVTRNHINKYIKRGFTFSKEQEEILTKRHAEIGDNDKWRNYPKKKDIYDCSPSIIREYAINPINNSYYSSSYIGESPANPIAINIVNPVPYPSPTLQRVPYPSPPLQRVPYPSPPLQRLEVNVSDIVEEIQSTMNNHFIGEAIDEAGRPIT